MSKNVEIADIFERIADSLDILEENPFKIRAYRNGSRNLRELAEDVKDITERDELSKIPGIGKDLAEKIREYIANGRIKYYEELNEKVPRELVELLAIQGLGPKMLSKLFKELKVKALADLEREIRGEEILKIHGMGKKKIEDIKRGIQIFKESKKRVNLGIALPIAEEIVNEVNKIPGSEKTVFAGSLRRMRETIGDIDILTQSDDGKRVIESFTKMPFVKNILASGDTKGSVISRNGIQVDLRVVGPESYGAALQYFTGSQAHNVKVRTIAVKKGLKINEYGLFHGDKKIAGETEADVYKKLGLPFIPPEMREDRGEIEAALEGRLPTLLELEDIKGDLHVHTNWSDGYGSIEEMALTAKKLGYEYIAVTDHSPSSRIANGLSIERLDEKKEELESVRKKVKGIRILMGSEVDILGDGSLDYPDSVLRDLDVVIVSVHSGFKMERAKMTKRIANALKNPFVHILAHPTGRLIGERDPYDVDLEEVFKTAKEFGKAIEVNSHYLRLDLKDINIRKAIDMDTKLVITTDSHHPNQLTLMRLGVATARRGWAVKRDIINTMGFKELSNFLKIQTD
ncbi:MAG TPA: DNA polymerase/3'-5' exonuclease PolX [Thermodesulfobacteriota bacterium]